MIRAGREVVDTDGIAALHGRFSVRHQKPWDEPGYPAPVNAGRPGRGGRKRLWDREQILAYMAGAPIPVIPGAADTALDDARDLLDVTEVAVLWGMSVVRFNELVRDGYRPGPDAWPCGEPHWWRETAQAMHRGPGAGVSRRAGSGRPAGAAREQIQQRLLDALEGARRADGSVNVSDLARAAGVSRTTAQRFLDRHERSGAAPS